MPTLDLYIKEGTWAKLLKSVAHDRRRAIAKIREMVEKEYGT